MFNDKADIAAMFDSWWNAPDNSLRQNLNGEETSNRKSRKQKKNERNQPEPPPIQTKLDPPIRKNSDPQPGNPSANNTTHSYKMREKPSEQNKTTTSEREWTRESKTTYSTYSKNIPSESNQKSDQTPAVNVDRFMQRKKLKREEFVRNFKKEYHSEKTKTTLKEIKDHVPVYTPPAFLTCFDGEFFAPSMEEIFFKDSARHESSSFVQKESGVNERKDHSRGNQLSTKDDHRSYQSGSQRQDRGRSDRNERDKSDRYERGRSDRYDKDRSGRQDRGAPTHKKLEITKNSSKQTPTGQQWQNQASHSQSELPRNNQFNPQNQPQQQRFPNRSMDFYKPNLLAQPLSMSHQATPQYNFSQGQPSSSYPQSTQAIQSTQTPQLTPAMMFLKSLQEEFAKLAPQPQQTPQNLGTPQQPVTTYPEQWVQQQPANMTQQPANMTQQPFAYQNFTQPQQSIQTQPMQQQPWQQPMMLQQPMYQQPIQQPMYQQPLEQQTIQQQLIQQLQTIQQQPMQQQQQPMQQQQQVIQPQQQPMQMPPMYQQPIQATATSTTSSINTTSNHCSSNQCNFNQYNIHHCNSSNNQSSTPQPTSSLYTNENVCLSKTVLRIETTNPTNLSIVVKSR